MATESKNILLVSPPNPFLLNPRSVPRIGLLYLGTVLSLRRTSCYGPPSRLAE